MIIILKVLTYHHFFLMKQIWVVFALKFILKIHRKNLDWKNL